METMEFESYHRVPHFRSNENSLQKIQDRRNLPMHRHASPYTERLLDESPKSWSSSKTRYYVVAVSSESERFSPEDEILALEEYIQTAACKKGSFANYRVEDHDIVEAHSAGCSSPDGSYESAGDTAFPPSAESDVVRPLNLPARPRLQRVFHSVDDSTHTIGSQSYTLSKKNSILPRAVEFLPSSQQSQSALCSDKNFASRGFQTGKNFLYKGLVDTANEQPLNLIMPRYKNSEDLHESPEQSDAFTENDHAVSHDNTKRPSLDNSKTSPKLVTSTDTESRILSSSFPSERTEPETRVPESRTDGAIAIHDNDNLSPSNVQVSEHQDRSKTDKSLRFDKSGVGLPTNPSTSPTKRPKRDQNDKSTPVTVSKVTSDPFMGKSKKGKSHKCPYCSKGFPLPWKLKIHLRVHTGEKPFQCHVCGKRFSVRCNLRDHIQLHTGDRPWKCEKCEAKFSWPSQLRAHERIHSGERPYKCQYCPITFAWSSSKTHHERVHRGEKKFKCSDCDMKFQRNSALANHSRVHTGLKPYKCKFCDREFSHRTTLKQHERKHTGEKPYNCTVCDEKFHTLRMYRKHMDLMHNSAHPYVCQTCLMNFQSQSDFKEHNRILHNKQGKDNLDSDKNSENGGMGTSKKQDTQDEQVLKDSNNIELRQLKCGQQNKSLYSKLYTPDSATTSDPKMSSKALTKAKDSKGLKAIKQETVGLPNSLVAKQQSPSPRQLNNEKFPFASSTKKKVRKCETQNLSPQEADKTHRSESNTADLSDAIGTEQPKCNGSTQKPSYPQVQIPQVNATSTSSKTLSDLYKEPLSCQKDSKDVGLDLRKNLKNHQDHSTPTKPHARTVISDFREINRATVDSHSGGSKRTEGYTPTNPQVTQCQNISIPYPVLESQVQAVYDCHRPMPDSELSDCTRKRERKARIIEQTASDLKQKEIYTSHLARPSDVVSTSARSSDQRQTSALRNLLKRPEIHPIRPPVVSKYPRYHGYEDVNTVDKFHKSRPLLIHTPANYSSSQKKLDLKPTSLDQRRNSVHSCPFAKGKASSDMEYGMFLRDALGSKNIGRMGNNYTSSIDSSLSKKSTNYIVCPACYETFSSHSVLDVHFVTCHRIFKMKSQASGNNSAIMT